MISKENTKYYILIIFIAIIIYKVIDSPTKLISNIIALIKMLSPFLFAILFTLLINPIVNFLENKFNLKRIVSIILSYLIIFFVLIICINIFIPALIRSLNNMVKEIPTYTTMAKDLLNKYMPKSEIFDIVILQIQSNLNVILKEVMNFFSKTSSDFIIYLFEITSVIFNILMGVILSIYIMYDKEKILKGFKDLIFCITTPKRANKIIRFFKVGHSIFYNYIIGRIIDSFIVALLALLGFKFLIKIDNVLFLSFIIFITNIIPYFGPFIGAILPISMTIVYSPIKAIWVIIFIFILQQIDGNIIGPKIMGNQVGLSPLWVICSVLIGGSLFGILGVFLSVPFASLIKIVIDSYISKNLKVKDSK